MDVKSQINLLLNDYNLKGLYYKYVACSICTSLLRESFYWTLIYFSMKLESKQYIKNVAMLLLGIYLINIPLERKANIYRIELLRRLKNANNMYFINKLKDISKKKLLDIDIVLFLNIVQTSNTHIQEYIINRKFLADIPITFVSVLIIILSRTLNNANNKGKLIIVVLLVIFFILILYLNEKEIRDEMVVMEDTIQYDNKIRNYVINSKTFLMNNTFNVKYTKDNIDEFNRLFSNMEGMENNLLSVTNTSLFVVFAITIYYYINEITPTTILRYFLIIYDIESVTRRVREFYKNKMSYDKMGIKLKILHEMLNNDNLNNKSNDKLNINQNKIKKINKIVIKAIVNDKPTMKLTKPLTFSSGEHILLDGVSGSGKTSLMYLLKGIIKVNYCEIEPPLEQIYPRCFITLPNHRDMFSANLYDILSNFDKTPKIELIDSSLKIVNLTKYINKENQNIFINTEKLSAGEFTRFIIARVIYQIKSSDNYDVLLFDEIDTNLNNELSIEICKTLINIFNDKIILYITHNDDVKKIFQKRITVKNGVIE